MIIFPVYPLKDGGHEVKIVQNCPQKPNTRTILVTRKQDFTWVTQFL